MSDKTRPRSSESFFVIPGLQSIDVLVDGIVCERAFLLPEMAYSILLLEPIAQKASERNLLT